MNLVARADDDGLKPGSQTSGNSSRKSSLQSLSGYSISSEIDGSISNEKGEDAQYHIVSQLEESSSVNGSIMGHYMKVGAHWSMLLLLFFLFLATQMLGSAADIWISIW